MKILLIDNFDSFTYNLVQLVEETGLCSLTILPYDKVDEAVISGFDGFVISPGPGIPDDFPNLKIFVRQFYQTKSILGVCMGYEAIGLAFGGSLYNLGKVFHGVSKPTHVMKKDHYFLKNIPEFFDAGLYHSWTLAYENFPGDLEIIANTTEPIIMAMSHRKYNTIGVQFHPESIMTNGGSIMIKNWLEKISVE